MSSPRFGFSSWRRSASYSAADARHGGSDDQDGSQNGDPRPISPNHQTHVPPAISSSVTSGNRDPIRSFIHGSMRDRLAPLDSILYARSVRDDSAELATYLLSDQQDAQNRAVLSRQRAPSFSTVPGTSHPAQSRPSSEQPSTANNEHSDAIAEVSEPESSSSGAGSATEGGQPYDGPSMLTSMIKRSPPESSPISPSGAGPEMTADEVFDVPVATVRSRERVQDRKSRKKRKDSGTIDIDDAENSPLLGTPPALYGGTESDYDVEGQKFDHPRSTWATGISESIAYKRKQVVAALDMVLNPKHWSAQTVWDRCLVQPVACLPAVIVGLLLNILDALSYGRCRAARLELSVRSFNQILTRYVMLQA